jgi:hypothetical protein
MNMASRCFNLVEKTLENEVIHLYVKLTIGTSGAVTLTRGKGVTSAALTATGRYTLTLDDTYARLLGGSVTLLSASGTVDLQGKLNAEAVATAATRTVEVGTVTTSTGAPAQPASGTIIFVELILGNTEM